MHGPMEARNPGASCIIEFACHMFAGTTIPQPRAFQEDHAELKPKNVPEEFRPSWGRTLHGNLATVNMHEHGLRKGVCFSES